MKQEGPLLLLVVFGIALVFGGSSLLTPSRQRSKFGGPNPVEQYIARAVAKEVTKAKLEYQNQARKEYPVSSF